MLNELLGWWRRTFFRHKWKHPDNGNPYRRTCAICGEQQEWDNGVPYETRRSHYYWTVWNKGDHQKHWQVPNNEVSREPRSGESA